MLSELFVIDVVPAKAESVRQFFLDRGENLWVVVAVDAGCIIS